MWGKGTVAGGPDALTSVSIRQCKRKNIDSKMDFSCPLAIASKLFAEKMFPVATAMRRSILSQPAHLCVEQVSSGCSSCPRACAWSGGEAAGTRGNLVAWQPLPWWFSGRTRQFEGCQCLLRCPTVEMLGWAPLPFPFLWTTKPGRLETLPLKRESGGRKRNSLCLKHMRLPVCILVWLFLRILPASNLRFFLISHGRRRK